MNARRNYLASHGNELTGMLVLLAVLLFGAAALQSGRLRDWFDPGGTLRVLLPQEGLLGLSRNASVDILGTTAGRVEEIVIDEGERPHAQVVIRSEYLDFVRKDSSITIRKRFGVAGDSYLDVTRGTDEKLDWEFAVLEATADRAPTDLMTELVTELRDKVLPTLDSAQSAVFALSELSALMADPNGDFRVAMSNVRKLTDDIGRGEGPVGQLLNNSTLVEDAEALLREAQSATAQLTLILSSTESRISPLLDDVGRSASSVAVMSAELSKSASTLPQIVERANQTVASLNAVLRDLRKTTPDLPRVTRGLAETTENLPALLLQAQSTAAELERLVEQLRGSWLIGGDGAPAARGGRRLSPLEVSP